MPIPVRVGLAFGIAPCGELWAKVRGIVEAKEFGGGAEVRAAFAYKMASYTLILLTPCSSEALKTDDKGPAAFER